jgi:hypothetical protein
MGVGHVGLVAVVEGECEVVGVVEDGGVELIIV